MGRGMADGLWGDGRAVMGQQDGYVNGRELTARKDVFKLEEDGGIKRLSAGGGDRDIEADEI